MIMAKGLSVASIALIFVAPNCAAFDLHNAYGHALSNDPLFLAAVKENEAGQANRVIGRAALMPKIGGSYTQTASDSNVTGPAFTGGPSITYSKAYPSDTVTFQLTQPVFNLEALAKMRQGMAQSNVSDSKFLFSSQDLLIRVLQAYTDVLYAEDNYEYLVAQRDAYKEQLAINEKMFKKGEGTITDSLETKASYELSEAQVIEARDAIENAKRKLEAIVGQRLPSSKVVKPLRRSFAVKQLVPGAFEFWQDSAIANNAEVAAANHSIEVARQEYQKQKAAHFPTVSAIASWNQSKSAFTSAINQNANTTAAGVQITIPIFSGGETVGRTSQARSTYEKSQADRDATRERVITETRKQYDLVNSSMKRIQALNRAVDSAQELTKAMRKSVQGGQRINLDILVADKGLATAKRDLAQAKYSYMLSLLRLKQAAGTLTVEDFERVAENFEKDPS
jgi:outer membrane protein, protease secretion system